MNVSKDCQHRGRFKKDCCEVFWNGVIIEHDGCVESGGCDLIAYNDEYFFIIEIKGGNISSGDASKVVEQIKRCESFYAQCVGHRTRFKVFLRCVDGKKRRIDSSARVKFKQERIIIKDCRSRYNLNDLIP